MSILWQLTPIRKAWFGVALLLAISSVITIAAIHDGVQARYPVTGTVLFDGLPVVGARLDFYDVSTKRAMATAETDSRGQFHAISRGIWPGIAVGTYVVTVSYRELEIRGEDFVFGADLASKELSDVDRSPLRVTVIDQPVSLATLRLLGPRKVSIDQQFADGWAE